MLVGAQVGYWMGNGAQPYAGVTYLGDRRKSSLPSRFVRPLSTSTMCISPPRIGP